MSKNLSAVASKQFDSEVKQAYQGVGILKPTTTLREGVVGDTYNFRKMGQGIAQQKPSQAEVIPMDVEHELNPVVLQNWHASEYTDIFDQAEVNFSEVSELAFTIAAALGRRDDQLIIDALDSTLNGFDYSAAGQQVDNQAAAFSVDTLLAAMQIADDSNWPSDMRHIVWGSKEKQQLLQTTEATSADFNTVRTLVNGEINSFMGFMFHMCGARREGGMPVGNVAADVAQSYAYHTPSVGYANGLGPRTEVNYIPERTSWLSTGLLKANAILRDTDGAIEILTLNTATNP